MDDKMDMHPMDVQIARAALAEKIEDVMARKRYTSYAHFADEHGIGRTTLYDIVRGRTKHKGVWVAPSLPTLTKLAVALEMPLHELVYLVEPEAPGADAFQQQLRPPALRRVEVGIAGWVGAGPEQTEFILDDVLWVDEAWARGRDLVAFRVRGDSMANPLDPIRDGDVVIVDKAEVLEPNVAVVATLNRGGYVCKLLKRDHHEGALVSANPMQTNGTPSYIPMHDVDTIIGRVVRVIHDL